MSDKTQEFRDLLASDAFAITFQSMAQYRTALLKAFDETARSENASLKQLLRRFEWRHLVMDCRICGKTKFEGHTPDCALSKLLGDE
jgi:hypothetical protein